MPAVTGLNQQAAETQVRDAGLEPETTQEESTKPQGLVIGQSPEPGAKVDEGVKVRLVVSAGPPHETVPDVVGETEAKAVEDLTAAGLQDGSDGGVLGEEGGLVVAAGSEGGANLKEGSSVDARGLEGARKPVTVPDVVGRRRRRRRQRSEAAGLKANVVARAFRQAERDRGRAESRRRASRRSPAAPSA